MYVCICMHTHTHTQTHTRVVFLHTFPTCYINAAHAVVMVLQAKAERKQESTLPSHPLIEHVMGVRVRHFVSVRV